MLTIAASQAIILLLVLFVAMCATVHGQDNTKLIQDTVKLVLHVDVDGDLPAQCVDHVIQFWMYYPYKKHMRVIQNHNPETGWNHLFVIVINLYKSIGP